MASKHKALADLFHHQLKDLHDAERHSAKLFAKLARAATAAPVRDALDKRHDAVAARVDHLEAVFAAIDKKVHGVSCEAMAGLVSEAKEMLDTFGEGPAIDAGVLAAAQGVEHYILARTGTLRQWAGRLDLPGAVAPLDTNASQASRFLADWTGLQAGLSQTAGNAILTLKQAALVGLR